MEPFCDDLGASWVLLRRLGVHDDDDAANYDNDDDKGNDDASMHTHSSKLRVGVAWYGMIGDRKDEEHCIYPHV